MKTENEIKSFIVSIAKAEKTPPVENMVAMTERAGHWLDCLEWVLDSKKED